MAETVPASVPAAPAANPATTARLEPVARGARVAEMDYLRGLAVFGILLVNMPLYGGPARVYFNNEATGWFPSWYDQAALWLVRIVAESKFYTLFSFLFGLGFGVQMSRATAAGVQGFTRLYVRRLTVLLAIGVVHLLLFWWGDVLHVYAVVGFLMLLFRNRSQKTLLTWALLVLLVPAAGAATFLVVRAVRKDTPAKEAERAAKREEEKQKSAKWVEEQVRTFASGSRGEVQRLRLEQVRRHLAPEAMWASEVFTMFLLGLCFARSGMMENLARHLGRIRRWLLWGLFGGVGTTLLLVVVRYRAGPDPPMPLIVGTQVLGHVVARPLHALFYASAVVLLVQQEAWRRRLAPMAAVGRMALTNYLTHTVVCVTLFNGVGFGLFGFGLYGNVGFAGGVALVVVIYAFQLWFSTWWLTRYRFGPMEWLWRSLTYGKAQPMALAPPATTAIS